MVSNEQWDRCIPLVVVCYDQAHLSLNQQDGCTPELRSYVIRARLQLAQEISDTYISATGRPGFGMGKPIFDATNDQYSKLHNDRPFLNGLVYAIVWSQDEKL